MGFPLFVVLAAAWQMRNTHYMGYPSTARLKQSESVALKATQDELAKVQRMACGVCGAEASGHVENRISSF